MKTLLVKLDIKPLSHNNKMIPVIRGKYARLVKSNSFRAYEDTLDLELRKYFNLFQEMGSIYDEKVHCLRASWSIYIPKDKFFTKNHTISKTCLDATNAVKGLEDRLVKILGIDDSQICETTVRKVPSEASSWCVCLELEIIGKPSVTPLGV